MDSLLRTVATGTVRVERDKLAWWVPLLGMTVCLGLIAAFVAAGRVSQVLPVGVGALLVPLSGLLEPVARRMRTNLWTLLWIMGTTLLGALVSDDALLITSVGVLLAPFVAFACGYAGSIGPNGRMGGVLALVCFAVFMGTPESELAAVETALLVGLGGITQIVAFVAVRVVFRRERPWGAEPVRPPAHVRLREHWVSSDDYLRHGVRLALAFLLATVISQLLTWPHQYWIPMTVAWVSLPDSTGTAERVVERVAGTLLALVVITPLLMWIGPRAYGIALMSAVGSLLVYVFIRGNYTLAVVGVTTYVVGLFTILGDTLEATVVFRAIDTVIAGVITLLCAIVWPAVSHEHRPLLRSRPDG